MMQSEEENSSLWKAAERTAPERVMKAVLPEADEYHLGVALIQPGSSRYEQMKVADYLLRGICKKGGTA